jgi:hypothetical protein
MLGYKGLKRKLARVYLRLESKSKEASKDRAGCTLHPEKGRRNQKENG